MNNFNNIIENKYYNWYNNIIKNAKYRKNLIEQEIHHIIPKSLGGSNKKDNLIKLKLREHYICHMLLPKFLIGIDKRKMIYALWRMCCHKKYKKFITSREYEKLRMIYIKSIVKNEDLFIKQSNEIHNNFYDYSLVKYVNGHSKVKIICPIHGIFNMNPANHYNKKQGCRKCYFEKQKQIMTDIMNGKVKDGTFISPFSNHIIHDKTMQTRKNNNSNIFITNNPMKNKDSINKKILSSSGKNHFTKRDNYKFKRKSVYQYKNINMLNDSWKFFDIKDNESFLNFLKRKNWNYGSFYRLLKTNKPGKFGSMKNILIRIFDENNKY